MRVLEAHCRGHPGFAHALARRARVRFRRAGERRRSACGIVGNLPYNISTPLLFHLLDAAGSIRDMHFMLQKEVVDRMAAGAGEDAYGRLSVMLAPWVEVHAAVRHRPRRIPPPPR